MRACSARLVDQDLADRRARSSVLRSSRASRLHPRRSSTIPGTATTSSPRTTSGQSVALGARDLRVDEHVLDLLPCGRRAGRPGRQPRTLRPGSSIRCVDRPSDAPAAHRALLEREPVVLAHGADAAAEVGAARTARRRAARAASARAPAAARPLVGERERCSRAAAGWSRLRAAGGSRRGSARACVSAFERVARGSRGRVAAVRLGLLAPERQQRPDDAVLARGLIPRVARSRRAGRGRSRPGRRRCARWRGAGRDASE